MANTRRRYRGERVWQRWVQMACYPFLAPVYVVLAFFGFRKPGSKDLGVGFGVIAFTLAVLYLFVWDFRTLHEVVRDQDHDRLVELLRQGEDPNALDEAGRAPLHAAPAGGDPKFVRRPVGVTAPRPT